jgi:hypothetical protein
MGCSAFHAWTVQATLREETVATDIKAAGAFLRRVDLTLRTGDAINIAIAQRMRALLVTFDQNGSDRSDPWGTGSRCVRRPDDNAPRAVSGTMLSNGEIRQLIPAAL